ncbi:MAG: hypothetical protein WA609_14500 [Terriglobales bacterium]
MPYEKIKDLCSKIADEANPEKLIPLLKQLREDLAKIKVPTTEDPLINRK